MEVSIRKFECRDIPLKVKWINDPDNNRYLHYDLPLAIDKTEQWFDSHKDQDDRYDATIEADGIPVGVIGLLNIDKLRLDAEYYITLGEKEYKGKGIATAATRLLLEYAFSQLKLNRVYLYTEADNVKAQALYERVGFQREDESKENATADDRYTDRIKYGYSRRDWMGRSE